VFAGVRRPEDGESLVHEQPRAISPVVLDVTNADHVAALDGALPPHLDAVVNNAGVVVTAPLEAVPLAELRRQLEVNVVGQVAVTQAVLPRLRESRGRVIFVSSLSGLVATPLFGPYSASKFALESVADTLRMELGPWGIRVVVIEPAQTDTDLWRRADVDVDQAAESLAPHQQTLYGRHIAGYRRTIPRSQRMAAPVEGVAATIETALTVRRPRARYVVGTSARVQALMARLTPTPMRDTVLRAGTGVPRRL
jgi:NAD(P)-dependent dehydrogenase (short-subunit alcohol dehydrogenase family)